MLKKIVIATSNSGKLREIQHVLQDLPYTLIAQSSYGISNIDETGLTFVENALLKARHAAKISGLPAIADDSGLVVDALQGAPGIYSARYAGAKATDQDNITKLLVELKNVPEARRSARFYCVIVLLKYADDPLPIICQGIWEGHILTEPQGENGFGYDPVFLVPEHNLSAARLDLATKSTLSHRAKALYALRKALNGPDTDLTTAL